MDINPTNTQDQALDLSTKPGAVKVYIGEHLTESSSNSGHQKVFTEFTEEDLRILALVRSQSIGYEDLQTMIHRYKTETVNENSVEINSDNLNNDPGEDDDVIIVKDEEKTSELVINEEMLHPLIDKSNQNKVIINKMIDEFLSKTNSLPMQLNQEQLKEKQDTEFKSTETKTMETNCEGGTSASDRTSVNVSAKSPKHKTNKRTLTARKAAATNQNYNNFMTLLKQKKHASSNHVRQQMHVPNQYQMSGAAQHPRVQGMYPRVSQMPRPPNASVPNTMLNMNRMPMTRYIPPMPVLHTVGSADPVTGTNMYPNQTATMVSPENPAYPTSDTIWYKHDERPTYSQSQNPRVYNNSYEPNPSDYSNSCEPNRRVYNNSRELNPSVYNNSREPNPRVYNNSRGPIPCIYNNSREPNLSVYNNSREPNPRVYNNSREPNPRVYNNSREPIPSVYNNSREPNTTVYNNFREPNPNVYDSRIRELS